MSERNSESGWNELVTILRDATATLKEENLRRRLRLEAFAAWIVRGREGIGLDEALEKLGRELDLHCLLLDPGYEAFRSRVGTVPPPSLSLDQPILDFLKSHGQQPAAQGIFHLPGWLIESFVALAIPEKPILFLNWSTSTLIPRFLLHSLQSSNLGREFVTVDRDPRVVEDLRLTLSLVIDDLDRIRDSVRLLGGERPFEEWGFSGQLNLFDTFGTGKDFGGLVEALGSGLERQRFGTVVTSTQAPAFQSPHYYAGLTQVLPEALVDVLTIDGRALMLGSSGLLDGSTWSKFRENARDHLHVESIVDFSLLQRDFGEWGAAAPVLLTLRQAQHAITRRVTAFAPASTRDSTVQPSELANAVVTFLNERDQLPKAMGFERPTTELGERWDPKFYCPARLRLQDRLISSPQASWLGGVTQLIERGASPSVLVPYTSARIAGVTFEGRQEAIASLKIGDEVWLQRQPDNAHDPNAVRVERRSGIGLGYLPRDLAAEVAEALDALNGKHPATVTELRGGTHDQPYGATIRFAPPEHAHAGEAVKVIRPKDIINNQLAGQSEAAWLPPEAREKVTRLLNGDILLLLRGFGKACVVPREFEGAVCHQDLAIIRPNSDIDPLYLLSFMVSADFQEQLSFVARGAALPVIDLQYLPDLLVLLPPLSEQRRIALAFAESQGELGPTSGESLGRWLEFASIEENREQAWVLSSLLSSISSDVDEIDSLEEWLRLKGTVVQSLRNIVAHGRLAFPDEIVPHLILGFAAFGKLVEKVKQDPTSWTNLLTDARQMLDGLRASAFGLADDHLQSRMLTVIDRLDELVASRTAPSRVQVNLEPRTIYAGVASRVVFSVENATKAPMEIVQFQTYALGAPEDADPEQILHPRAWLLPGESFTLERVVQIDRVGRVSLDCEVLYDQGHLPRGPYWELATFELEVIPSAPVSYVPIQPNPYITGGAVDSPEMFFGRQDVLDFLRDNLIGKHQANVIILQGNRRTGKSSILKQVVNLEMFAPDVPVYIDCQGLGTLSDQSFFYKVARVIWKTLVRRDDCDRPPPVNRDEISEDDPFYDFQEVLDRLAGVIPGRRIILLIDEFEIIDFAIQRNELSSLVLENLRHLFQHRHDLAVVLTGSYRLSRLGQEYWSALFGLGLKREVGFLDESATRQLITQPIAGLVDYPEEAIKRIIQLTACQPYFVQMVCHNIVNILNKHETPYVTQSYVEEAALETLVSADGHMRFMYKSAGSNALKAVLVYLASSLTQPDTLSGHEIESFAHENNLSLSFAELEEGLREMADRDIVEIEGSMDHRRYGFKIDLIRQWIRRNYDLRSAIALAKDASYVRES